MCLGKNGQHGSLNICSYLFIRKNTIFFLDHKLMEYHDQLITVALINEAYRSTKRFQDVDMILYLEVIKNYQTENIILKKAIKNKSRL